MSSGRSHNGGRGGFGGRGRGGYDRSTYRRSNDDRKPAYRPRDDHRNARDPRDARPAESHHQEYEEENVDDHGEDHGDDGEHGEDHGEHYDEYERNDDEQEEYVEAENFHQEFHEELEDSEDDKPVVKFKGLSYEKAQLSPDRRKFSGVRAVAKMQPRDFSVVRPGMLDQFNNVVMKSRPAEDADYDTPFRNKGSNFDDGSGRHGTNRVWSKYSIPRKPTAAQNAQARKNMAARSAALAKKDAETRRLNVLVKRSAKRSESPFVSTKDGPKKRRSPNRREASVMASTLYDDDDDACETAKSS